MCGIAGLLQFDETPPDRDRLAAMLAHVRHRGPDGEAISLHGRCGLALAQLSILDLGGGAQPMHLDEGAHAGVAGGGGSIGRLHVVFNGEIYNHRYLRATLEKRGHRFRSDHSDTEVLLLGYREWGRNLPRHLHGMFAFALWDEDEGSLFLCRDRMGKKPLFFRREASGVAFASTLGGVIAGGEAAVNVEAVLGFLRLGYTLGESLIEGVRAVPPAHWVQVRLEAGDEVAVEYGRYWMPPPISKTSTAMGAVEAVREVLGEAVASRLEADVPLGLFLSGGLDSALVAATAQRAMQERGFGPLNTFTVAMPGVRHDPTQAAAATAKHLGTHHTLLRASTTGVMDDLRRLVAAAGGTGGGPVNPAHPLALPRRRQPRQGGTHRRRGRRTFRRVRAVPEAATDRAARVVDAGRPPQPRAPSRAPERADAGEADARRRPRSTRCTRAIREDDPAVQRNTPSKDGPPRQRHRRLKR